MGRDRVGRRCEGPCSAFTLSTAWRAAQQIPAGSPQTHSRWNTRSWKHDSHPLLSSSWAGKSHFHGVWNTLQVGWGLVRQVSPLLKPEHLYKHCRCKSQ